MSVYGCGVSLSLCWIYRCIHLKELTVRGGNNVTDTGITMVISHCNQLHLLDLSSICSITGMCALREDPEPTLRFITMVYDILTAGSSLITKATTGPYCEQVQFSSYMVCPKSKCTDFLFNYLLDLPEIRSYLLRSMTLGKLHSVSVSSTDHSSTGSHFP